MFKTNAQTTINNTGKEAMSLANILANKEKSVLVSLYTGVNIDKEAVEKLGQNINCLNLQNKQKALAVMSYGYGSLVGVTTTGVSLGLTVLSNSDQYFDKTGRLNFFKIRKVFKNFGKDRCHGKRYTSVFTEQINKIGAINRFNRYAMFVKVSAREIEAFDTQIKELDANFTTKEDLAIIARDLDIIGRAMQELAIDVTKDKSKDIGYDIMSFIETRTKTKSRLIKHNHIVDNLDKIINAKYDGKEIEDYKMDVDFYTKLVDADPENKTEIKSAVVEDLSSVAMDAINDGYNKSFEELIKTFKLSNNNKYNNYISLASVAIKYQNSTSQDDAAVRSRSLASVIKTVRIALSSITSLYAAKDKGVSIDSEYIKETAKKLRDALYTYAAERNIEPKKLIQLAIAASFCNISNSRLVKKSKPSFAELWAIFPKEFVLEYTGATGEEILTPKVVTYDLCLNDELYFEEGYAETEWGSVVVAEEYTGKAIVTEDGITAIVNHYDYTPTKALFLDEVCESNVFTYSQNMSLTIPGSLEEHEDYANVYTSYNVNRVDMVRQADACATFKNGAGKNYLLVKKGDKVAIVGRIHSANKTLSNELADAVISHKCAVVFLG